MLENRDLPKFESSPRYTNGREGSTTYRGSDGGSSGRFFGQSDEGGDSDFASPSRRESRPAPDMRRLLLNNVNVSRRSSSNNNNNPVKSGGSSDESVKHVIRAI